MASEPTFILCPHCGEPVVMTELQRDIYAGRALACVRCAKRFNVTAQTPLYTQSTRPAFVQQGTPPPKATPAEPSVPLAAPLRKRRRINPTLVILILFAVTCGMIGIPMWLVNSRTAREDARSSCASNLQHIGMCVRMYAQKNGGSPPDSLQTLLQQGYVTQETLRCPASGQPYVYRAGTMGADIFSHPTTIVAYEQPGSHADGINILDAGGTVTHIPTGSAAALVQQLQSGTTARP